MGYTPKLDWIDYDAGNPTNPNAIPTAADLLRYEQELEDLDETVSLYRTNKDAFDIFTTIEWKRADGTLLKKSLLSGGTAPAYTTRTVTYYAANGSTVRRTYVYTLNYTGSDLTSEVLT